MPSEERVMRAREVLAEALDNHGDRSAARGVRNGSIELGCMAAIEAMIAFSDEGSGIVVPDGYALVPIEPTKLMIAAGDEDAGGWATASDIWRVMLAASPDIDRSGLAQEVG